MKERLNWKYKDRRTSARRERDRRKKRSTLRR
jgi:hypothetical protein